MKKVIYCLGDSNTWGFDPRSPFGDPYDKAWPELLGEQTGAEIFKDGLNGRSLRDCVQSYDLLKRSLTRGDPDLLILLLGSNDILMEDLTDPAVVAGRMDALLKRIRADFRDLPLFLLSPPEIRIPGPYRDTVKALGGHYHSLSQQFSAGFLNLAELPLPLCYDGVHLTEDGHRLLAGILKQSL